MIPNVDPGDLAAALALEAPMEMNQLLDSLLRVDPLPANSGPLALIRHQHPHQAPHRKGKDGSAGRAVGSRLFGGHS